MTADSNRRDGSHVRDHLAEIEELKRRGPSAIPELIERLIEPSWTVRRAAIAALAEANPSAVPELGEALRLRRDNEARIAGVVEALAATQHSPDEILLGLTDDENVAVACDAVQILGRRGSLAAISKLEELTRQSNDNLALAAIEALGRLGSSATDSLLLLLQEPNFFRTFPALDVLGRSGDKRAIAPLLKLAADPLYGSEAVRALGRLGDLAVVVQLIDLARRASESQLRTIAVALVSIHEQSERLFGSAAAVERALLRAPQLLTLRQQLIDSLKRSDPAEVSAIGRVLSWIGDESTLPTLLGLLSSGGAVAEIAAGAIKKLAHVAEPQLLEALRNGNTHQRRWLVSILSGRDDARDDLIDCLDDPDAELRALTCDALARGSNLAAVPALFRLLEDTEGRVAAAAVAAIQSLGSGETQRLALAAALSDDLQVRCAALKILGYFGQSSAMSALKIGVESSHERERDAALSSLPFIEHEQALELILHATQHASARTRAAAVRALGHTRNSEPVAAALRAALQDESAWVRYYACQSLGKLGVEQSVDAIVTALADGSGQVRVAAVEALAHFHDPRAFELLLATVNSPDPDLHRAALVALGLSKQPQALTPLLQALTSGTAATRLVALSALAELGRPEALPALVRASADDDASVRAAAQGFLATKSDQAATEHLIELLRRSPDTESLIRSLALPAQGRLEALSRALSDADDTVATALVAALARTETSASRAALREALKSPNDAARRAVAAALVAVQDVESVAALERAALNDPDAEVRRICSAAIT